MKLALQIVQERILDYDSPSIRELHRKNAHSARREFTCKIGKCPVTYTLASLGQVG
jgi:hypothetical protein